MIDLAGAGVRLRAASGLTEVVKRCSATLVGQDASARWIVTRVRRRPVWREPPVAWRRARRSSWARRSLPPCACLRRVLGAVLAYADVGDVADALREGDWGWFVAALLVMAIAAVVGAFRWRLLLEGARVEVSRARAIRVFSISLFLNNVLPTSVGGDAVRAWLVGRESGRLLRGTAATVADKVTALACLFVLAWLALAVDPDACRARWSACSAGSRLAWRRLSLVAILAAAGVEPVVHRLPKRLAATTREALNTIRGLDAAPQSFSAGSSASGSPTRLSLCSYSSWLVRRCGSSSRSHCRRLRLNRARRDAHPGLGWRPRASAKGALYSFSARPV